MGAGRVTFEGTYNVNGKKALQAFKLLELNLVHNSHKANMKIIHF